jgi:hypothetical protein
MYPNKKNQETCNFDNHNYKRGRFNLVSFHFFKEMFHLDFLMQ